MKSLKDRKPRRVPLTASSAVLAYASGGIDPVAMDGVVHRAELDYILDPEVRPVDVWAETWAKRWPDMDLSLQFWRQQSRRNGWERKRTEAWAQYQGQALEVFLDHEIRARADEFRSLRSVRDKILRILDADEVEAKSFEGMVKALVELEKLTGSRRDEILKRFSDRMDPNSSRSRMTKDGGLVIDADTGPAIELGEAETKSLVRALLAKKANK